MCGGWLVGWEEVLAGGGDGDVSGEVADSCCVGAHGYALVFRDDIDEDHAGDLGWVGGGVVAHYSSAEGVAYEDEGSALAELAKGVVEFEVELGEGAGFGAGVAPCVTSAIVGADAGEVLDFLLDEDPGEGEVAQAVFYDGGVGALAGAVNVETVAAEVDEPAGRFWSLLGGYGES